MCQRLRRITTHGISRCRHIQRTRRLSRLPNARTVAWANHTMLLESRDIVLDPLVEAAPRSPWPKLGRQWIGCELSKDYVDRIRRRLDDAKVGDSPTVPPTRCRRRRLPNGSARGSSTPNGEAARRPSTATPSHLISQEEIDAGILDAYKKTHAGPADHLLADPNLNAQFIEACMGKALPGAAKDWNHRLLCVRKMGKLPRLEHRVRTCTFNAMDPYSHASEIALQQLNVETGATLDEILCDPTLAARFDDIAASFAPGYTPFEYRWAALAIRRERNPRSGWRKNDARSGVRFACRDLRPAGRLERLFLPRGVPDYRPQQPAALCRRDSNLRQRIDRIESTPAWQKLKATGVKIVLTAVPTACSRI